MTSQFWNAKHRTYEKKEWIRVPTYFAEEVIGRFPQVSAVLDAGCGQGQDTTLFAAGGHRVTAMDFSDFALAHVPTHSESGPISQITASLADFPYPFEDGSFDVVYAHLSVHYFDASTTRKIFAEFHRVLRSGGLLCVMVNSVDDPEWGEGRELESDFYQLEPGDSKRYFSRKTLSDFTHDLFLPYLLEQHGRTRKDRHQGFVRLVAERIDKEGL
ncbi:MULTISPECIES: methyltransferase domain-containing protein [unclassified Streptomyces]|uniref:methyltransferase domain-containing protein n=1 Tax=unclassified Streptomyces TaxID=2593676 RepID=UPI00403CE465